MKMIRPFALILLFFNGITFTKAQDVFPENPDSLAQWYWDDSSESWMHYASSSYTYDSRENPLVISEWNISTGEGKIQYQYTYDVQGNVLVKLKQSWQNNQWVNETKETNSYTVIGSIQDTKVELWNGTAWQNSTLRSKAYNANGNEVSSTSQSWNGSTWINESRWEYGYDNLDRLTSAAFHTWGGTAWENSRRHVFTWDTHGNRIEELYQDGNGTLWENDFRTLYAYDASNYLIREETEMWNGSGFNPAQIVYLYAYDSRGNRVSQITQEWGINLDALVYTFDNSNNLISTIGQYWNNGTWSSPYRQDKYAYDGSNRLVTMVRKDDWNGTDWNEKDSTQYYYHTSTNLNEVNDTGLDVLLFPNPSNGQIYFSSTEALQNCQIIIYDTAGELIYHTYEPFEVTTIDLSPFPKGMYIVHLMPTGGKGKETVVKRIVIH